MSKRKDVIFVSLTVIFGLLAGFGGHRLRENYEQERRRELGYYYAQGVKKTTLDVVDEELISGGEFLDHIMDIVHGIYVEEIKDETPLAHGALDFLFQELHDTGSRFYTPKEWKIQQDILKGIYRGIGANVIVFHQVKDNQPEFPIVVVSVPMDSVAWKAGLRPGDVIEEINGKWVASRWLVADVHAARMKLRKKQITQKQFDELFSWVKNKIENLILVPQALQQLLEPTTGETKLKILRNGKPKLITIQRDVHRVELVEIDGNTIRIRGFDPSVPVALKKFLEDKKEITIDLRENGGGSFESMQACLELLIPEGTYAQIKREPDKPLEPLRIERGVAQPIKIDVYVDEGTAREAELFAVALRDRANAKWIGSSTFGLGAKIERFTLQDGSGYTLTSGMLYDIAGKPLYRLQNISTRNTLDLLKLPAETNGQIQTIKEPTSKKEKQGVGR
ncbi:MAG TPA: S41 family peptidase [Fimbriimonadales bacterium]|nr:S41 family peptidase [Fimbriimonadales bacterium]